MSETSSRVRLMANLQAAVAEGRLRHDGGARARLRL